MMRRWMMITTILLISSLALLGCGGGDDPTPEPAATATIETVLPSEPAAGPPAQQETTDTGSAESTGSEGTTAEGGAVVAPSSGNPAVDAVAEALRRQIQSLPMRMTMSGGSDGETMVSEMTSPTRFRVNAGGMEFVLFDGTVYMNQGGTWIANDLMGEMVNSMVAQFTPDSIEGQIDTITGAEQLPDEQVNGEATSVYLFTATSPAEGMGEGGTKVYVRKSDGLPIRISSADGAETPFAIDYEYDSSIVIEPPQ